MHVPHGHSVHYQQTERVGGTPPTASVQHGKPSGATGGFAIEDQVDLSESAKMFLETGGQTSGPGKSMSSPAHMARAIIANNPQLAGMPFGQVVSQLNHGTLDLTPPAAPAEGGEAADAAIVADTGDIAETPIADGDTAPVIDGDTAPEIEGDGTVAAVLPSLDDGVTAEEDGGQIVLPEADDGTTSIVAEGEGETPVVGEGDGETTITADAATGEPADDPLLAEPVITVDTTSTLLDMLDGNGDETETDQAA